MATNYNKMSEKPVKETKVVDTVEEVTVAPPPEPVFGFVSNCRKLNVRQKPNKDADIVCVINKDTEVIIEKAKSTKKFYKVFSPNGPIDGFCMKEYITIKQ